ncbi:hypothetical protein ANN_11614 [Periplaneta americana]|uniref:Uncharacterized protein n=1 Tax=Periplaneta americana TaxID=6978 RepID=A0ABQ8T6L6_PERAM|nr:hypothetical protein ANN_11614 [Periplaneta americana]
MSPGSGTESYPAFARIGLRENPGNNLNQCIHFIFPYSHVCPAPWRRGLRHLAQDSRYGMRAGSMSVYGMSDDDDDDDDDDEDEGRSGNPEPARSLYQGDRQA